MQSLNIPLPTWLQHHSAQYQPTADLNARMGYIIQAAENNIQNQTGGPFAAGIFRLDNHQLIALGTNLVPSTGLSILHAEMLAISLAQQQLGHYDLKGYELICNAEPCSMCLGAIPWSGIQQLSTAATDADIRAIGFDEGNKPDNWQADLQQRGIRVTTQIQRQAACQTLKNYQKQGGEIYNASHI